MADDSHESSQGGTDLSFVKTAISRAVEELQQRQKKLPQNADAARQEVAEVIERLERASDQTRKICAPTWYMAPR